MEHTQIKEEEMVEVWHHINKVNNTHRITKGYDWEELYKWPIDTILSNLTPEDLASTKE